jgi:hypothetical protein
VIEAQLSQQEKSQTVAAYNHARYTAERQRMMQWWAIGSTSRPPATWFPSSGLPNSRGVKCLSKTDMFSSAFASSVSGLR